MILLNLTTKICLSNLYQVFVMVIRSIYNKVPGVAILLIAGIFMQTLSNAGNDSSTFFLTGLRFHYGFIIAHTEAVEKVAHSNPLAIQADFSWHFISNKSYEFCNCYPRLGFSLYYWDYRNPEMLGQALNLLFFAEPFFNPHKKLSFSVRPGMGLAYLNNPYDEIKNPDNLSYSTRFAYALLINLSAYYKISNHFILNVTANYNHISNGGVKMPNKGLNYPSLALGLEYSFLPYHFQKRKEEADKSFTRKDQRIVALFLGFKGITEDDKLYFVKGIYGKYGWHTRRHSVFSSGLEFIIDGGEQQKVYLYKDLSNSAPYMLSATGGYQLLLGKFALTFDLGIYLYNTDRRTDLVYQRYGATFNLTKKIFTGINLKAYRHVADFFDVRFGFIL